MKKTIITVIIAGFILYACSSDPVSTGPGPDPSGYTQVYTNAGVLDSLNCSSIFSGGRSMGIIDLSSSDSIKISFEYIAVNTNSYGLNIYYENGPTQVNILDVTIPGNQNSYTPIEFTAPSPNTSREFFYIMETSGTNCYFVIRNIKISKK